MKCLGFKWNLKQSCEIILFQKSKSILLRQQDYVARLASEFCWANKWFIRLTKKFICLNKSILLGQQNSFVRLTKRPNKKKFLAQQNRFVAQITTKLFYCNNKILVGQEKPFSQWTYLIMPFGKKITNNNTRIYITRIF